MPDDPIFWLRLVALWVAGNPRERFPALAQWVLLFAFAWGCVVGAIVTIVCTR